MTLILASTSQIRQQLLSQARVPFQTEPARIDEDLIKTAMIAEGATPREIADALAEGKARKVSLKSPGRLVLGCDQVLDFKGDIFSKPKSKDDAKSQLSRLRNDTHKLLSAAVIYDDGKPVWRHVGQVRLTMRNVSDTYLDDYIDRNWDDIQHCVGAYQLEGEGVRLFARVDGSYFDVLGLPLVEVLSYLTLRGDLPG